MVKGQPGGSPSSVAVLGFARTPFGKFGGALVDVSAVELGTVATAGALSRSGVEPGEVDELVMGVNFPGSDRSIARQVQLRAGIPAERNAFTVDRACCSSLTAIHQASRGIRLGESDIAVAGGAENLSQVPYYLDGVRFGHRLGDIVIKDKLVIACPHTHEARAVQASREAATYGVFRDQQDEWALRSQERYQAAAAGGFFDVELLPVELPSGDLFEADEVPRPGTTIERLARLRTVYGSETVTAGNAPDLSAGATALVLAGGRAAERGADGMRVTLEGFVMASGEPANIASIPARAAELCLARCGLDVQDVDVIEINEAFAAVPLVSTLILAGGDVRLAEKLRDRTNVNGGAVAIGHPTGATAGRLVMTVINTLTRRGGGIGLVSLCGGIGEAEAVLVRVADGGSPASSC